MRQKLFPIGKYIKNFNKYLPYNLNEQNIYCSVGLEKHISKRHPDCLKYMDFIQEIVSDPDYIGINPNEKNTSFELIKVFSDNFQIGIKLDTKDNYLYVATLHNITTAKIKRGLQNGS